VRLLVLPHSLSIGGSQRNAIDLARVFREHGDAVMVAGPRGVMGSDIVSANLDYQPLWIGRLRPSPRRMRSVRSLINTFRPDVVHAYEWPSALEAYVALRRRPEIGLVTTVMSMDVDLEVPRTVPLLVGTPALRAQWSERWRAPVGLCEPPVDTAADMFDPIARHRLRQELGIDADAFVAVIVSRVDHQMKFGGIAAAVQAMARLDAGISAHLVVVGSGNAMSGLRQMAAAVNAGARRTVVHVVGELLDPRAAYSAADVVLGMGGSALRSMAHARPTIVLGEDGFVRRVDTRSIDQFVHRGFFGIGTAGDGAIDDIARELTDLAGSPARCDELGRFGKAMVCERYALDRVAAGVAETYAAVRQLGTVWDLSEAVRAHTAAVRRELRLHVPARRAASDIALPVEAQEVAA